MATRGAMRKSKSGAEYKPVVVSTVVKAGSVAELRVVCRDTTGHKTEWLAKMRKGEIIGKVIPFDAVARARHARVVGPFVREWAREAWKQQELFPEMQ